MLAWPLLFVRRPWVVAHHTWIRPFGERYTLRARLKTFLLRYSHNATISRAIAERIETPSTIVGNPYSDQVYRHRPGNPARPGARLSRPARLRQGRRYAHPRVAAVEALGAVTTADHHRLRLRRKSRCASSRATCALTGRSTSSAPSSRRKSRACSMPIRFSSCPRACRNRSASSCSRPSPAAASSSPRARAACPTPSANAASPTRSATSRHSPTRCTSSSHKP